MSQLLRFIVPAAALLLGPALTASCGPSVQSIYEGDVRFEHCYRLDLELDVATTHRQACWTTWLDRYTYGQSHDRLEYARRRVRAFATGDTDRPALRVGEQQTDSRQFYLVVPSPTSVHAPPPPIATRINAVSDPPPSSSASSKSPALSNSAEAPSKSEKPAPAEDCASACKSSFSSCNQACDPAANGAACKSCDPDYKKCMARCFE